MKRTFVFAYASLPGHEGQAAPVDAVSDGDATLRGYRLASTPDRRRDQTLVVDRAAAVHGTLFRVSTDALDALDETDSGGFALLRTRREVRDATGRRRRAWVYLRPSFAAEASGLGRRYDPPTVAAPARRPHEAAR